MKHCLDRMNDGGAIVNVSSLMGQMGYHKERVIALQRSCNIMTKSVALEGRKRKIRVNALHPGVIWTTMVTEEKVE